MDGCRNIACCIAAISVLLTPVRLSAEQSAQPATPLLSQQNSDTQIRENRVVPKESIPAAADAALQSVVALDPVLIEIEAQLQLLSKASLPLSFDAQMLFDVPLEDVDAVAARIAELQAEQKTQRANRADKQQRKKRLHLAVPPPQKPEILASAPIAPIAPIAPTQPVQPDVKRPKGKPRPDRSSKWQTAFDAWQQYDRLLAVYTDAMTQYTQDLDAYQHAVSAHETALAAVEAAQDSYRKAQIDHLKKRKDLKASLQRDLDTISLRNRILTLRITYLKALHRWIKPITAPARTALGELKQQRRPLNTAIELTQKLDLSLENFHRSLEKLANRADAGSISGFQIKLSQLAADLRLVAEGIAQRRDTLRKEAQSLKRVQKLLREQSNDVRRLVFANVLNPKRDELIDRAFRKYLSDMRKASSAWFTDDNGFKKERSLIQGIDKTSRALANISAYSEAQALLSKTKTLLEKCDVQIDETGMTREHQKQIFRRQAVAILSGLASDQARKQAYSFSQEILADLTADLYSLKNAFSGWLSTRKAMALKIPALVQTRDGILQVLRIFAAMLLLILTGVLGRKYGRMVSTGIRQLSRSRLFRNRPGRLLRYAGLVEAVLPTLLVGATLYAAFAIVGFGLPEVRFSEVVLRWMLLYRMGEKLLIGFTQRVSRGRPAFVQLGATVSTMLINTYRRLGLVSAIAAIFLEWSSQWFGSGILNTLIVRMMWGWLLLWATWALIIWRIPSAETLASRFTESANSPKRLISGRIHRTAQWMKSHWLGVGLTAPVIALLILHGLYRQIRYLLYEGGIVTFFRARLIRRLVNTRKKTSVMPEARSLPEQYTAAFPLYPIYHEEDAVLLPRKNSVSQIAQQIEKWKVTRQDSSLVLLGEKGIGKTTLLTLLDKTLRNRSHGHSVHRHSIGQKLKSEKALVAELAAAFGIEDCAPVVGAVASWLNQGDEKIVLLDECHNMFMRTIDGYDAYESLIRLVNVTSQNVFWVLVFNSFSFAFLNASKRRLHYFRKLHALPAWSRDDMFELISRRNRQSGFDIEFDEVLLDANRSATGDFEVIEGADGFFRLLWENSGGNPRVATCLWLDSLSAVGDNRIRVGIFAENLATEMSKLDVELLYTLAAICQHENLSVSEVREVLNVSIDFANFAVRFLTEYGLIEPKHTDNRRHTLAPRFYPQVIKLLRGHHLLYEKE